VAAGIMPPWMPDDDCRSLEGSYALTDEERALIAAWAEGGFPMGKEADFEALEPVVDPNLARRDALGAPDLELDGGQAYTPDTSQPDDYRCIPLDHTFSEDTFVRGMEVALDRQELVHHMILYMYYPEQTRDIQDLERRDAADPDVGFTCFENPPADTVMGWAPGQLGEFLPADSARYVPAGGRMFLQIHYNTLGRKPAEVGADRTGVKLWTTSEVPESIITTLPFANDGIFLPAGDPEVKERASISASAFFGPFPGEIPVVGVMAHMHQLGTAFKLEFTEAGARRKECALDIPRWDFGWQRTYFFPEEAWLRAESGAEFHMLCQYDNSAENQLVVNGERLEPRDVTWGENTTDEMCLAYLMAKVPAALWLR